jgi:hypothetical protein
MRQSCGSPLRLVMKMISWPSGEKRGEPAEPIRPIASMRAASASRSAAPASAAGAAPAQAVASRHPRTSHTNIGPLRIVISPP